jgi:hypothetical protein
MGRKLAAGVVEDGKRRAFTMDEQVGMLGRQMFGDVNLEGPMKKQLKSAIEAASSKDGGQAAGGIMAGIRMSDEGQKLQAQKQKSESSPGERMSETAINKGLGALLKAPGIRGVPITADEIAAGIAKGSLPPDATCFPGSVKVLMADGTEKAIEDVRVGDEVVSVDVLTGSVHTAEVVDLHNHLVGTDIVEVNGVAMTTNHPIWVNDGWVLGEDIKVGDTIHQMKSSWSEPVPGLVTSVVRIPKAELGEFSVYNIFVAEHGNYVAGGLLASEDC